MDSFFKTEDLAVGYNGSVLIRDISLGVERGKILTLIGPNAAGKTTILKTVAQHLDKLGGAVYIDGRDMSLRPQRELARQLSVVLTDRIRPELMTCAEVTAMGRYPHTGFAGRLTPEDKAVVQESLERVGALDLAGRQFTALSDGQRQRIMLARALCQQPQVMVLDEPTAYLDIRYKTELLDILRELAREKGITVIMSLHEIDLAAKVSDYIACVKGDTIAAFGPPEKILTGDAVERLYDVESGSYNLLFGSIELKKPKGEPKVFVVAGGGHGIYCYRELQKRGIPFASGILFENDVDTQAAKSLSDHLITAPAFEPMTKEHYQAAESLLLRCEAVFDAGTPSGSLNAMNSRLLKLAGEKGIPVYRADEETGGTV